MNARYNLVWLTEQAHRWAGTAYWANGRQPEECPHGARPGVWCGNCAAGVEPPETKQERQGGAS